MGNWWAESDQNNSDTFRKMGPKSNKKGSTIIEQDELVFNIENSSIHEIQGDLYSDFSENENNIEDELQWDDTDWEYYDKDLTIERKGKWKNMFKEHIYDIVLNQVRPEILDIFHMKGPLKVKPKDIPPQINQNEIEFNHHECKNYSGDVYIGQFRKGTTIREGRGVLISSENHMYEGFWIDDQKFGFGRILLSNGNIYQGEWSQDVSRGLGIYCTAEGLMYKGEWVDNKWHGQGVEIYQDGSKFRGYFKNGEK